MKRPSMRQDSQTSRLGLLAAGLVGFAGIASAQSLITTSGVIVATDGDVVPDANGIPIPGFTFGGGAALNVTPVLDEQGNILFLGRMLDSGASLTAINDKAFFYGSSRSTLKLVVQGGSQAPGLPAGILLRTTTGSATALGSTPRISPDGRMFWGSSLYDGGVTVTSANDQAVFGGFLGAQGTYVRRGDVAPGTGGATYVQAFSSPNMATTGINRNGRIYFLGALTVGTGVPAVTTTSGMNNQAGVWAGLPGALELVARRSDPVAAIPGVFANDTSATLSNFQQMNNAGHLLYDLLLSQTQGTPAATPTSDYAVMVFTPGAGSQVLVREGDTAPGTFTPSTMTSATFNAISGSSWSPGIGVNGWTRNDETIFTSDLVGGDVIPSVTDRAVFKGGVGTLAMIARRGDPAPGTDGVYSAFTSGGQLLNASGQVCLKGTLEGGTTVAANDTAIWAGAPGSLALVLREGDILPGTGGSIAGSLSSAATYFNDQGQVLITVALTGGTITGTSLWSWDAVHGLAPVVLLGDQIEVHTGQFLGVTSFAGVQNNNSDGAALTFGHDGTLALRLGFAGGVNAQMTVRLPSVTTGTPYCFGDGSGTACPCGNAGATGNGCASSINPNGGKLAGEGLASITSDSFSLHGSGLVLTSGLYFQGTTQQSGGAGAVFGDGLRCAAGSVVRLGTKFATNGESQYPVAGDASISVKGGVTVPGTREYQLWYRNAGPFCTPSTFNLTNGLEVTWVN
jgi:hypothetical protein